MEMQEGMLMGMIVGAMSCGAEPQGPPLIGRAYRRCEEQFRETKDEKHLKSIEFLLESIHPRHYEELKSQYEALRKEYKL